MKEIKLPKTSSSMTTVTLEEPEQNTAPVEIPVEEKSKVKISPIGRDVFLNLKIDQETERAIARENELEAQIEEAGKIDDVKVDGTSVVTNKVANIVLQPKLDALEVKIPTITKGSTEYKFKIRVVNNKPQLVFEEI